jgi:hypothetical protein
LIVLVDNEIHYTTISCQHTGKMCAMVQPCPFVDVSGTPYERGRQHGAAVPQRVKRSIELYGGQLDELGYDAKAKSALIAEFASEIEHFGAHYIEEMRGIADGAGVALEDIVMVNARTEVIAKARLVKNKPIEAQEELDDGCTGAIILPERSASGELIHGQNWDWKAECAETAIVLRVRRTDGPDFLTFVEAGGLARCGMNAAGISITANYLESERDFTQGGVPLALIRRKGRTDRADQDQGHRHPARAGELLSRLARPQAPRRSRPQADRRRSQAGPVRRFPVASLGLPPGAPERSRQSLGHRRDGDHAAGEGDHGSRAAAGPEPRLHPLQPHPRTRPARRGGRIAGHTAFSSEVDTGSREENAQQNRSAYHSEEAGSATHSVTTEK